ncbi:MAG: 23S rRNA (adenine(2503)-C(2))-methyltransferase RlmN [Lachnospiraceae bacterium]|nr:23S rRNA (adenine(2503)-C(2))-methyltransferase RlmN [Lachnospiraceae bacterium]
MVDIKSLPYDALKEYLAGFGEPKYRADQVFSWLHAKRVSSFAEMTNLPKSLREKLQESCILTEFALKEVSLSKDGTRKFLFELPDGTLLETVLMRYPHGYSACISTQAGCRMGCGFCASGAHGLARNLAASEILEQVYAVERIIGQGSQPDGLHNEKPQQNEGLHNIVVMGMGEPLDNYEALIAFLSILGDKRGRDFSLRQITVSTCGLVPEIYRFAKEGFPVTLALSLHAPDEAKRQQIMPIARKYSLRETLRGMEDYFLETGRRITLEYALIKGFNDAEEDASKLAGIVKGMKGSPHVNLIRMNPVRQELSAGDAAGFQFWLEKNGINVTIRKALGRDIESACGQLRNRALSLY